MFIVIDLWHSQFLSVSLFLWWGIGQRHLTDQSSEYKITESSVVDGSPKLCKLFWVIDGLDRHKLWGKFDLCRPEMYVHNTSIFIS